MCDNVVGKELWDYHRNYASDQSYQIWSLWSPLIIIMQSLRTGKASQPRQKPSQRPQVKLAKSPSRAARKSRVDDKIKKRLSMRYADISAPTGATGVPDVPSLPIDVRPAAFREQDEVVQDRSAALEDPKAADRKILDQEEFNPDACEQVHDNANVD